MHKKTSDKIIIFSIRFRDFYELLHIQLNIFSKTHFVCLTFCPFMNFKCFATYGCCHPCFNTCSLCAKEEDKVEETTENKKTTAKALEILENLHVEVVVVVGSDFSQSFFFFITYPCNCQISVL